MSEHLCVACPQLRLGEPRHYERAHVCDGCRARLLALLAEVATNTALLPRELLPGASHEQRVSGSREAPLPFHVDALDLDLAAREETVHDDLVPRYAMTTTTVAVWQPARPDEPYVKTDVTVRQRQLVVDANGEPVYGPSGDQTGYLSVATVLDSWARDWREVRERGERQPVPVVAELVVWLANRTDWACEHHPAIDEYAHELNALARSLRRIVNPGDARPTLCEGVPCRRCDLLSLWRNTDGTGDVECHNPECRTVYRAEDYHRWVALVAASARTPRMETAS